MNKTLLIILVDFLLLTILSLTKWEEEREERGEASPDITSPESVSAMAVMEQDLLDTLQSSLEEERMQQERLAEEMRRREEALQAARAELQEREQSLERLDETLEETRRREQALQEQSQQLSQEVQQARRRLENLELAAAQARQEAQQSQAQSRMLQQELQAKLEELEAKEQALAQAAQQQEQAQQRIQELNIQVKVAEQESKSLQENVSLLREEIVAEREEKRALQEQTGKLAEGVTQLAEQSQDLRQELRSSIPINANQLFDEFLQKRLLAGFKAERSIRGRPTEEREQAASIFVSDGQDTFALLHVDNTPMALNRDAGDLRSLVGAMKQGEDFLRSVREMAFLQIDPRIAVLPVSDEDARALGKKVYLTALEPFKFPNAVLIDAQGSYYGEVEFKLDAETPGYVKMQSKIFSALFGEFSPSTGDLVLSMTGELLGIMVNRRYCALIDNFVASSSIRLGPEFSTQEADQVHESLQRRYRDLPGRLR